MALQQNLLWELRSPLPSQSHYQSSVLILILILLLSEGRAAVTWEPSKEYPFRIKVNVKWSRYRPGVAQSVGRGIAVLFHDRGTGRGWVVSSTPRPHFTLGKDPVPILQEAGWAPGPVWTGGKSRPYRDSIPDRPARSQWLYWLSYRAHTHTHTHIYIYTYIHTYIYTHARIHVQYIPIYIYDNILLSFSENQKYTFYVRWLLFRKSLSLWDNVEKYCRAGQAKDDGMAHAHCVLDT